MVVSSFSVEIFLSHSTETFRTGPFCAVFQRISGSEKFMSDRALSRLSIKSFFLSHSVKNFPRGTLPSCVLENSR